MVKRVFLALVFLFSVQSSYALTVRPMNVEELIVHAERIFLGTVTKVYSEHVPGRPPAMVTQFKVLEVYKGMMGAEVLSRQLARKGPLGELVPMVAMPQFALGETAVVFLTGESSLGFSSPLGLKQGTFRMVGKTPDQSVFLNGRKNHRLFSNITHSKTRALAERIQSAPLKKKHPGLSLKELRDLIQVRLEED